jgi:uroporphyrin-3 C-methyltransferase
MVKHQKNVLANSSHKTAQGGFVVWIAVVQLLVIGVLLTGGYYFWKQYQVEVDLLHKYVAKVEVELGIKSKAVTEFKNSLAKIAADSDSQDVIIGDHLRTLEDHIAAVDTRVKSLETSGEDWLLAEIEYLLKMADLRIAMKQDVKGAVRILRNAEELIKKMPGDDKGLLNVRVAITQDIATMELYREIDVPGTYAALVSLGDTIEKLPIIPSKLNDYADKVDEPKSADTKVAKKTDTPKMLSKINEAFAGYLTIRKHDTEELKALLSPEQRLNFRDSVRLTLDQAQTALLRGDQAVYDASLSKIRKWVLDYFVADNFKVQMASKKIEELSRVQVKQDLPSVAESQQELKRYITDKMLGY